MILYNKRKEECLISLSGFQTKLQSIKQIILLYKFVNIQTEVVDKFFLMLTILAITMLCQQEYVDKIVDSLPLILTF